MKRNTIVLKILTAFLSVLMLFSTLTSSAFAYDGNSASVTADSNTESDKTEDKDKQSSEETVSADVETSENDNENIVETAECIELSDGSQQYSISYDSDISINVTAGKDIFPYPSKEMTMMVKKVESTKAETLIGNKIGNKTDMSNPFRNTLLFDITFLHNGLKVEPDGDVKVEFIGLPHLGNDAQVFHVDEDKGKAEELKTELSDEDDSLQITTDHFSVYGVTYTYTVDFHYENNTYSIPGGSSIMLSELFTTCGIDKDASQATDVKFSDSTLMKIEEIMSTEESKGTDHDWKLTSLQPFDTDETLSITFEYGEKMDISVTDLAAGIIGDATNQVIKSGTVETFSSFSPFSTCALLADNDVSQNKLKLTNVGQVEVESQFQNQIKVDPLKVSDYDIMPVLYFEHERDIKANRNFILTGKFATITYPDAAIDSAGKYHDVVMELSNLNIKSGSGLQNTNIRKVGFLREVSFVVTTFDSNGTEIVSDSIGIKVDANIKIDGVETKETFMWGCSDLDTTDTVLVPSTYDSDEDGFSERFKIISGAISKAYIPNTNILNISSTSTDSYANGLLFRATEHDDATYNSGCILQTMAGTGLNVQWAGGQHQIGTRITVSAKALLMRPHYKSFMRDGSISDYKIGNDVGYISVRSFKSSDTSGETLSWDSNEVDNYSYFRRYYINLKYIAVLGGWDGGYYNVALTRNTAPNDDPSIGAVSWGTHTISDDATYFDAFYAPITGTLTITKKDSETNNLITGAEFSLSGTSSVHGTFNLTSTDNGNGTYTIKNVPYGYLSDEYTLSETKTPEGYNTAENIIIKGSEFRTNNIEVTRTITETLD